MADALDREHAEIIRHAAQVLNHALHEAWKAGLKVDIRVSDNRMLGHESLPTVYPNIYRPL